MDRFVNGEMLDACVPILRGLNGRGLLTNATLRGKGDRDGATAGGWQTPPSRSSNGSRPKGCGPTSP